MEFLNGATLEQIIDKTVGVMLRDSDPGMVTFCTALLRDGKLFIDCIPQLNGKHVKPVPDDATILRADAADAPFEYLILIGRESDAGKLIKSARDAQVVPDPKGEMN